MKSDLKLSAIARYLWVTAIGMVVTGSLSPGNSSLMRAVDSLQVDDKILHFIIYLLLAMAPVLGLRRTTSAVWGAASMVVLGLLLEIGHSFVPGRTPGMADEIANTLGVGCGLALAFPFRPAAQTLLD